MFNFIRHRQTFYRLVVDFSQFHQKYTRVPVTSHSSQPLLLSSFEFRHGGCSDVNFHCPDDECEVEHFSMDQ